MPGVPRGVRAAATPWTALTAYIDASIDIRAGAFSGLAGRFDPDEDTVVAARTAHARVQQLVRAAQADGSLRPDVSASDIHELVALFSRRPADDGSHHHRRLLALAVTGLRSHEVPLPGRPAAWEPYEARWTSS